ncbi:replication endonuclease [Chromobacterium violaceum]|uniref:replication endonuclease n=1 Tax=Chromobacterium violaceum TaxID=536 RepID=UPI001C8C7D1B|nr:replication endonuclease [Chromobacterium violaceum]MBX9269274.1 replication endonuclease [Chromobacterium violaceum]
MLHPLSLEYRRACLVEDREWVDSWLRAVPSQFAKRIRRQHNKLLFSEGFRYDGDARRAANLYVQDCRDHLAEIGGGLNLAASDAELCQAAKQTVQHILSVQRLFNGSGYVSLFQRLADYLAKRDVFFFDDEEAPEGCTRLPQPGKRSVTHESIFKRLTDEGFWRKVFRRGVARKVEAEAIRTGLVNQRSGLYVSDDTLTRFRSQRSRNRSLLESLVAFNELGDEFTLAELADLSVSNPDNRRAELMTRIAGFEAIARSLEHAALFLTITCPSRFHAFRKLNKGRVIENTKYSGSTPRQAQQYLSSVYACIRAELHRREISPYGFRIAEPHHDACPHWHLLLFVPASQADELAAIFREYATREDHEELAGNVEARFKCIEIDWARGTAAGYVAKYVCKNVDGMKSDGEPVGVNFDGMDTVTAAERVLAWASCWGIRQFQQVGVAPVTLWRELRRIAANDGTVIDSEVIGRAAEAADAGDWAGFVRVLGGTGLKLGDLPIRLSRETGRTNRYGEDVGVRILGVADCEDGVFIKSRLHEWTVEFAPNRERSEPWTRTRVNNCTATQRGGTTRVPLPAMRRGGDTSRPLTVAVHEQRAGGVT